MGYALGYTDALPAALLPVVLMYEFHITPRELATLPSRLVDRMVLYLNTRSERSRHGE